MHSGAGLLLPFLQSKGQVSDSTHLVADHHMDTCGALPVHAVNVLGGNAVQIGDLLN